MAANPTDRAQPERISARASSASVPQSSSIRLGLLLAVAAVACAVAANFVDVVKADSAQSVAAGSAAAVSVILTALAPLIAIAASALRRVAMAGAVLAGAGLVAIGAVILDLMLLTDPINADRLELYRPLSAAALTATTGAYLVLGSHVLLVVAGLAGWTTVQREALLDGYGFSENSELYGRATAVRIGGSVSGLLGICAALILAAQFAPPFTSTDPVFLVPAVIDSAYTLAIGSAVLGLAVVIATASALASSSPAVGAGVLMGAASLLSSISATRIAAALSAGDRIGVGFGSVLSSAAALVLLVIGAAVSTIATTRDRRARSSIEPRLPAATTPKRLRAAEIRSTLNKWHMVTGIAGIAAGLFVAIGSFLPILTLPDGAATPTILATRVALVAGVLIVAVSVPLLASEFNSLARPVLAATWVAVVMASTGVLQAVVLAKDVAGVGIGVGAYAIGIGVVLAIATGVLLCLAGSAERDDIDTSDSFKVDRTVLAVAVVGAAAAAIGLALPLYRGADVSAAAVGAFPWGWDAWGQVIVAATVIGIAFVAPRSRPSRGAALLLGSVLALAVYLSGWPLTDGRAADSSMGPGVVPAASGLVILAVAAVLSARRRTA